MTDSNLHPIAEERDAHLADRATSGLTGMAVCVGAFVVGSAAGAAVPLPVITSLRDFGPLAIIGLVAGSVATVAVSGWLGAWWHRRWLRLLAERALCAEDRAEQISRVDLAILNATSLQPRAQAEIKGVLQSVRARTQGRVR